MNKNLIQKAKELVKKEGFYIILFLCLCVILVAGTFSYKKYVSQNEVTKIEDTEKDVSYNDNSEEASVAENKMQNAERVENSAASETEKNKTTEKTAQSSSKKNSTATVSTNNKVEFVNPLNGEESRTYTYPKPVQVGENTFRTIKGINISAKIGTDVKCAADGVVEIVENSGVEEGVVVQIKHANGLKTRYGNLDPNVNVKNGEKVTANQVIGKVGESAKVFSKDIFGEFLNLQVIDANNEQVNPENYFKFNTK